MREEAETWTRREIINVGNFVKLLTDFLMFRSSSQSQIETYRTKLPEIMELLI